MQTKEHKWGRPGNEAKFWVPIKIIRVQGWDGKYCLCTIGTVNLKLSFILVTGCLLFRDCLSEWKDSQVFWNCPLYHGCLQLRDVRSWGSTISEIHLSTHQHPVPQSRAAEQCTSNSPILDLHTRTLRADNRLLRSLSCQPPPPPPPPS